MKTIREIELRDRKVVLRAGFDVPVKNGKVEDETRIVAGLETIKYIFQQQPNILAVLSHLGRPERERVQEFSNKAVARVLERELGKKVVMVDHVEDFENIISAQGHNPDAVYLLENIRFWKEETDSDEDFGKKIGQMFDVYVNDAFSVSHRDHASFTKVPKHTAEKCAGLLLEEEVTNLSKVRNNPPQPAVMVIGGAKIETKLPVIENLKSVYEKILVGGLIANEALDRRMELGEKVMLPVDFAPAGKESERLDIGPVTIEAFEKEIAKAATIVWNGPMGKFEDEEAAEGTKRILKAIASNKDALQVIGGGETLDAISDFGNFEDFDYVSMSGGAMLEFMAGKELPGLAALE